MEAKQLPIAALICSLILLAQPSLTSANQETLDMYLNTDIEDSVEIRWTFNDSTNSTVSIYGYRTVLYSEEDELLYTSPLIHATQRQMTIQKTLKDKTRICVQAFTNDTEMHIEKCDKVSITDLKAVVGILAGTIFLIPCIIGLFFIIYKDRKITKFQAYQRLQESRDEKLRHSNNLLKKKGLVAGVDNKGFVSGADNFTHVKHVQTRLGKDIEEVVVEVKIPPTDVIEEAKVVDEMVKVIDEVSRANDLNIEVKQQANNIDGTFEVTSDSKLKSNVKSNGLKSGGQAEIHVEPVQVKASEKYDTLTEKVDTERRTCVEVSDNELTPSDDESCYTSETEETGDEDESTTRNYGKANESFKGEANDNVVIAVEDTIVVVDYSMDSDGEEDLEVIVDNLGQHLDDDVGTYTLNEKL